jgi:hypothetical protein
MELPDNIKILLEALRGGNVPMDQRGPATVRRLPDGSVVQNPQSPSSADNFMPTKMRGYQLYNQERKIQGLEPVSYQEWIRFENGAE